MTHRVTPGMRRACLVPVLFLAGAGSARGACPFADNFERPNSNDVGNGWIEQEVNADDARLFKVGGQFGTADIKAPGTSIAQEGVDTGALTDVTFSYAWARRNATGEFEDKLRVEWKRNDSGVWNLLAEHPLNSAGGEEAWTLPPSAEDTVIDIRFTTDVGSNGAGDDPSIEGAYVDDVMVCGQLPPDCNSNGVADTLDIAGGTSADCNSNALPDGCELSGNDCNINGVLDECDVSSQNSEDCNINAVPDESELFSGADVNADCAVSLGDYAPIARCLTGLCGPTPCAPPAYLDPCCRHADLDDDGDVDLRDFAAFQPALQ